MKPRRKILISALVITLVLAFVACLPQIFHENSGESKSHGSVRKGSLENEYLLPYRGSNFKYFSPFSYYILNSGYVHSTVYDIIMDAYETCETTCPDIDFRIMECSNRHGGKMLIHWTHQNGVSVDFMIPKMKKGRQYKGLDRLGIWHYLLAFDDDGKSGLSKNIEIDFETMAKHLIAIDDAARRRGMRIRKIILKKELHDNLFASPSGAQLQQRNLRFVRRMRDIVNRVHDDHYHIDFEFVR